MRRGERPDGRPAEQAPQSVADAAVGSQTFSGSFNISGVIAATVQCFFSSFFSKLEFCAGGTG